LCCRYKVMVADSTGVRETESTILPVIRLLGPAGMPAEEGLAGAAIPVGEGLAAGLLPVGGADCWALVINEQHNTKNITYTNFMSGNLSGLRLQN
jgi:hypothetical protein